GYIQLDDDQPGGLGAIPLPNLDSGPYLSYGLQWLTFGIMAPLGAGYFIWSEIRERRRRSPAPAAPRTAGAAAEAEATGGAGDRAPVSTAVAAGPADRADTSSPQNAEGAGETGDAEQAGAIEDAEFAHVLRGRRKPRPRRPVRAEPERPAPV